MYQKSLCLQTLNNMCGVSTKWHLISALNFFLGHFLFFNLKNFNVTLIFNIYFCTVNFKHGCCYIVSINFPCPTSPKKFPLLVHTKVILDIFWDIAWSLSLGFVSNHILVVLSTLWGQSVQWEDVIWKQPLFKTGKTIKWLCL